MIHSVAAVLLGLSLRALGAPDEATSGIPKIILCQTGGDLSFTALAKRVDAGDPRAMAPNGCCLMLTRERPYDPKRLSQAANRGDALGHSGLASQHGLRNAHPPFLNNSSSRPQVRTRPPPTSRLRLHPPLASENLPP